MERLRRKGHLRRKRVRGVYRYWPKLAKGELFRQLTANFVETSLGGSISPFVAFLAESGPVSDEELAALGQWVRDLEDRRKEDQP